MSGTVLFGVIAVVVGAVVLAGAALGLAWTYPAKRLPGQARRGGPVYWTCYLVGLFAATVGANVLVRAVGWWTLAAVVVLIAVPGSVLVVVYRRLAARRAAAGGRRGRG